MRISILKAVGAAAFAALACAGCTDSGVNTGKEADVFLDRASGATYRLNVSVVGISSGTRQNGIGGYVNPNGGGYYTPGETVNVKASPASNYQFISWSGASTSTSSSISVKMDEPKTLTAEFKRTYTLNVSASPSSGGSVSRNPSDYNYLDGTNVTVTASAYDGYVFTGWSGASTSTNASITLTMHGDLTLTANFKRTYTLTVNADPPSGGGVSRSPDKNIYMEGDVVTVTATAYNGYAFVGWSGASSSTNAAITVTMDGNKTLTAAFKPIYRLTTVVSPYGDAGVVERSPNPVDNNGGYVSGTWVTVKAVGSLGYTFRHWTNEYGSQVSTSNPYSFTMNDNRTLTAVFEQDRYSLTVSLNPLVGGSVTRNPDRDYTYGEQVTLTAKANEGYVFTGWSGESTSTSTTITVIMNGPKALTANFKQRYLVAFNANGGVGAPPDQPVDAGNSVMLPYQGNMSRSGYTFAGWNTNSSGTGTNYNAGTYYTPDRNVTLYAKWNELIPLTANVWANGSITSSTVGGALWYSFSVSSGTTYYVYLNDSDNGGGTLDAKIAASYATSGSTIFDVDDNVRSFTANSSGTVLVKVYPLISGTGTFAVTYSTSSTRPILPHTVSFNANANGATGTPPASVQYVGTSVTLPNEGGLSRAGYTFLGWSTQSNSNSPMYTAGSSYPGGNTVSPVNGTVVLYAIWKAEE